MAETTQKIIFGVIILAIVLIVGVSVFQQYKPAVIPPTQEIPAAISTPVQPEKVLTPEELKSHFKITKYEGIRATNIVRGAVKNINDAQASVTINAKLHYAGNVVAEKSVTLENVKIYEERSFEIQFDNPPYWNAVSVEIV